MFASNKFTERTRRVIVFAHEEALRLHSEQVDTEHLLLGLIREGQGLAATVLQGLVGDLGELQARLEAKARRNAVPSTASDPQMSEQAIRSLNISVQIARELEHSYPNTEHVLLGLLREGKGTAATVLAEFGVTEPAARLMVLRLLGDPRADQLAEETLTSGKSVAAVAAAVVEVRFVDGQTVSRQCATLSEAVGFLVANGMAV